jgi:hypothetical protein
MSLLRYSAASRTKHQIFCAVDIKAILTAGLTIAKIEKDLLLLLQ